MSDPVGFDFNDTLDFLSVLQDSVPSLQTKDEYASTFLDTQLMLINENLDCSPDTSPPGEPGNYLFLANDSSPSYDSHDGQDYPSNPVSMMTDDATFLTEFSSIHSGSKSELKSTNTHSPLTPQMSSKGLSYDQQPQNMFNSGSMPNPLTTTPQSNPLRGGSLLPSVNASKSPLEDIYQADSNLTEDCSKQEQKSTPKAVLSKRKVTKAPKKLKLSHNVIEKKYRTNINTKILELRDVVPSLRIKASSQDILVADLEGLTPASKLNKASVLTKATEYIKHLESKHESLDNKIAALQSMISQSPSGSVDAKLPMADMMGDISSSLQRPGFSSQRGQNYYSSTPVNVQYANQYSEPSTHTQNCGISNSNLFMGGFATLLGANYVSEDNFRGMASLPFLPARMAVLPSTQFMVLAKNFLMILGVLSMSLSIYNFVAPNISRYLEKGSSQFSLQSLKTQPLSDSDKQFVLDNISGKRRTTLLSLIRCHMILMAKDNTFENSFLLLLVCSLLIQRAPVISKPFSTAARLKVKDIRSLPCKSKDAGLQNLSKLTKDMDGFNLFYCSSTISRLSNLSNQKLINSNVSLAEYSLAYVDIYLKNKNNIYSVVFGWRVLAIIHKLNLVYLDILATSPERREEKLAQFTTDLAKLEDLLGKDSLMNMYLHGLQMIARPSMAPQILESIRDQIADRLTTVSLLFEDREVTDEEMTETEDEEVSEAEAEEDEELVDNKHAFDVMRNYKSLISSMQLMNEERFIAIVVSLVVHCLQKHEEKQALQLLQYLKYDQTRPLSLLSFTALVQLVTQVISADSEQHEEADTDAFLVKLGVSASLSLELLLKMMRVWLKDDRRAQALSQALRVDLTEIVMNRALILNKL